MLASALHLKRHGKRPVFLMPKDTSRRTILNFEVEGIAVAFQIFHKKIMTIASITSEEETNWSLLLSNIEVRSRQGTKVRKCVAREEHLVKLLPPS
jgi:hypothetical protein